MYCQGTVSKSSSLSTDLLTMGWLPTLTGPSHVLQWIGRGTVTGPSGRVDVDIHKYPPENTSSVPDGVLVFYKRVFSASKYMAVSSTHGTLSITIRIPTAITDAHGEGPHRFYFSVLVQGSMREEPRPHVPEMSKKVVSFVEPQRSPAPVLDVAQLQKEEILEPVKPLEQKVHVPVEEPQKEEEVEKPKPLFYTFPKISKRKLLKKGVVVQGRFGNDYNYSSQVAIALQADRQHRQRHGL